MSSDQPQPSPLELTQKSLNTEKPLGSNVDFQLGRYHLLERIGEGGMGEVYVAEQREPYYRKVAVKLIKQDVLNSIGIKQYVARFEAERQALALMNHPNIAKVIDGGATPIAGPYIVMELCQGTTLDKYCSEKQLDLNQRLTLFLQVCEAVEHAHQKGILHRDLKPSNIIVNENDKLPSVKVIDFGLAKALQPAIRLTDRTLHTRNGVFLGTYKYTSPEQAFADNEDVDTRSDIYSLGIILFELLTDTTPVDDRFIAENIPSEILRVIREVDAPRPSSVTAHRNRLSGSGQSVLRRNAAAIRNELDWITLKAIQKERHLRYQSVTALADDIRNFLSNEPISARPPSQIYRLRKFASRNRAFATAVFTSFVAITAIAVGAAIAYRQTVTSKKEINKSLKAVEESFKIANEAKERLKIELALNQENTLKAAETAKISGINAWSSGQRRNAVEHFIQSLYLKPHDRATTAWLYSTLADKASFPIDNPDIVFGGNQEIKRALLSRDGSGILAQHADNSLRAYSVDRMIRYGVQGSQQGATFTLDGIDFVFDLFRNKKANALYILAGTTPTPTNPPTLSVWSFNGKTAKRLSSYQPSTQFYTEPFFGPSGEWYVARGGNDLSNRNLNNYSLIDSESGQLIQNFEDIANADSFAISSDGSQIITTGIPVMRSAETAAADLEPNQDLKSSSSQQLGNARFLDSDESVYNNSATLFNLASESLSKIPLATTAHKVGFTPLGRSYIENREVIVTNPVIVEKEESFTVMVPVTVEVSETYKVQVPVIEKSKDGEEVTVFVEEERVRTKTVTEYRPETRTRTVQKSEYVSQLQNVQVEHIDKTQASLAYISIGGETHYYSSEGKLSHTLPNHAEPVNQRLQRLVPTDPNQQHPYQLQFFEGISAVGVRNAGDFEIIRVPASDNLQGVWPAIPWASFSASPFAELHLQPKFSATINESNDTIAIPVSANAIHIYRLSTTLAPLPPPLIPRASATHTHVHSTVPSETWLATSNSDERNKIVLMEIRPKNAPIPLTLALDTKLERYGDFFIDRPKKRFLISDYLPPTQSGFCVECGAAGASIPTPIKLDATGTPRSAAISTDKEDLAEKGSPSGEQPSRPERDPSHESTEKSLLVGDEEENSQSSASPTTEKQTQPDLYRDFPLARFSVVSFPDGNVLADRVPGILSDITQNSSIALVRNFNRLYFYDTGALTWFKGWLQFEAEVTSCRYSPNGKLFAVGTKSGLTVWYDSSSFAELGRYQLDDEIVELEFDLNNAYLAVQASNYLPLPQGVESHGFSLLDLVDAKKIFSSQNSVQFRGFSPDGTRALLQTQIDYEASFSVMELATLELIVPSVFSPYASYGLHVEFVNDDLIAVTEGNETWLFSCHWKAPASPRFTHPDIDRTGYFRPRAVSIANTDAVTLIFDASSSIRSWQVELPVRNLDDASFDLDATELRSVARTFLDESSLNYPAAETNDDDKEASMTTANDSKWRMLLAWLTQRRTDKSLWPDPYSNSSIRSLDNELTRIEPRSTTTNSTSSETSSPTPAAPLAPTVPFAEPPAAPATDTQPSQTERQTGSKSN